MKFAARVFGASFQSVLAQIFHLFHVYAALTYVKLNYTRVSKLPFNGDLTRVSYSKKIN